MTKNFICANPRPAELREINDCTVRATSLAMNKPYKEVHGYYELAGRVWRRGVSLDVMNKALQSITKSDRVMVRVLDEPTFAQFARANPKGRFIVVKRRHAVALIDGVWHDAHIACAGARSRVLYYYEIK